MKLSDSAIITRKTAPSDEESRNAQLLIRAGYIHKVMAGSYMLLPLGERAVNNIIQIIREEMNNIGGQELTMTTLQNPSVWKKTNRWSDEEVDIWFKTKTHTGDVGLGWTHEEPITELMTHHINSYKDLPVSLYQFQTKFRNEKRAKSGIMRTREFIMKDLYTFSKDKKEHDTLYNKISDAYETIFKKVGIGDMTYKTFASGGAFAQFSHEFQTLCDVGEDIIYIDKEKNISINEEVYTEEVCDMLGVKYGSLVKHTASEVGNIFTLGTKFSEPLQLLYTDKNDKKQSVCMGSYGIGPARILGIAVELYSDENSMVLPTSIAPYRYHLIDLSQGDSAVKKQADKVYDTLQQKGDVVLYDDTSAQAGEKFANADLIGIPHRIIVSEKSIASGGVEYTNRHTKETSILSYDKLSTL